MAGKRMADSGYQYDVPAARSRVARVSGYKQRPLGPSDEDRLRWQRFLDELPERIDQMRADEAPLLCPTCGSTTPPVIERKWCCRCQEWLPASAFYRNRSKPDGRDAHCKACRRPYDTVRRVRRNLLKAAAS